MANFPPRGVRPPQLEGRRTGRPRGSKNRAPLVRAMQWGFEHRYDRLTPAPSEAARLAQNIARHFPEIVERWLAYPGYRQ